MVLSATLNIVKQSLNIRKTCRIGRYYFRIVELSALEIRVKTGDCVRLVETKRAHVSPDIMEISVKVSNKTYQPITLQKE